MVKVQFVNSVKYNGKLYPAYTPFDAADKDAEHLIKSGAIIIEDTRKQSSDSAPDKSIQAMKIDELKAYAEAHNIDISKAKNKAEALRIIKASKSE